MRMLTVLIITLFMMTQVGTQETGSSLSKIRQKRSWVVEIYYMKRGFTGVLDHVTFYDNIAECKIYGPGINENPIGLFHIDSQTKEINVDGRVLYNDRKNFTLFFECAELQKVYKRLAVEIIIQEIHEPYFSKGTYFINVEESTRQGTNLLTMHASNRTNNVNLANSITVNPNTHNVVFFINQKLELSFAGCLDYEENEKYTVVIEVKDQSHLTSHSSTATVIITVIDNNDHIPVITGKKGDGRIKERQIGAEVYQIQVEDKDSKGSPAWRAKFTLHGEKAQNFKIEPNPNSNEGVLSVIKPLVYWETHALNLTVQVENEEPFFSCSVRTMYYNGKLCDVDYSSNGTSTTSLSFPIIVEQVKGPPEFTDTIKHVTIMENTPRGQILWTFTLIDQHQNPPSTHRFIKGKDIDNWVTVDSKTGTVSTAKVLDRESPFVKNSTYTVILIAVDNGTPPGTGTGTLIIHLLDENDNAPILKENKVALCLMDSMVNITAIDPDLPPFSSPFTYELLDDGGMWMIKPNYGETVNLVKNSSVFWGSYEFTLNINDSGGLSSLQKLSVTVHKCSGDRQSSTRAGVTAICVFFICLLIMLCVLLMVFKCSWGFLTADKKTLPDMEDSKSFMCRYNDEGPGEDLEQKQMTDLEEDWQRYQKQQQLKLLQFLERWEITEKEYREWILHRHNWNKKFIMSDALLSQMSTILSSTIEKKLLSLHEEELGKYKPHPYDNEGEPGDLAQLDSISIAESQFDLDDLEHVGPQFQQLATQCRPDLIQQSYTSDVSLSTSFKSSSSILEERKFHHIGGHSANLL